MTTEHICIHEERFANLEAEMAEANARLESKKEDIQQIQAERLKQNKLQMELIEKVTVVTTLLEASQKQRDKNNEKFDALEKKVDNLQTDFTDFVASQRSFRSTIIIGIPIIISIIVGVIFHFV
ncbi:MAG: hypothetical protein IJF83_14125 [Methanobrevibacter sp.]|nr:hypothetical protein [Methanobrevibacter sp.]